MSFNINNFKQNIDSLGYIKNNKFEVYVQAPRFLRNKAMRINGRRYPISRINNILKFRIEQVRTPSVSLLSLDTNRFGIGPTQKMPFNAQYFDTTFSILLDRNTDLWDYWYNWTNAIFNFNGKEPSSNNPFVGGRIPSYTVEYKDEYSTTMMIIIYDDTGRIIKTINLYEAFPSSIREIQLAWNDNINLMRLSITVTYSNYSIEGSSFAASSLQDGVTDLSEIPALNEALLNSEPSQTRPYYSPGFSLAAISPVVVNRET
jgi:hypothetical protein